MKKTILFLLLIPFFQAQAQHNVHIVPMPVNVNPGTGSFNINEETKIIAEGYAQRPATIFSELVRGRYGLALGKTKFNKKSIANTIHFIHDGKEYGAGMGVHTININTNGIIIGAGTEQGLFYGMQTLLQLMDGPGENNHSKNHQLRVPQLSISDHPRFPYRGIHLDVCRHFFPVSFIKKYIDYLAAYKYNTFHWHLTDDQGWRIEIKKYPHLTNIGSKRNGTLIGRYPGKGNDNKPLNGYYTQAEIKEVVAYAKARYIEVIPEIEMPGHSSAAIAAYPWLSCFPQKPTTIPANMISQKSVDEQKKGRIKLVQETWGVFDDVFCAGKDSTFLFLEGVIDEVAALFPSTYFHMGGDESPKAHWKICSACQQRMRDHKLKDEHELQSWFVRRIERYVNSKGKTLIGWDEILEGGLAPNAVVMSWRGEKGGIEAAKQKHKVIMTPGNPVYFDHTQSANEDSVTFGGYNPIENVYAYEPVPKELNAEEAKYVLGAQANMWTEYQSNPRKIEYQLFPRITALSEVLWSPKDKRDWRDFERRLPGIFDRLDKQQINYSRAYYDLKATVLPTENFDGILWKGETNNKNVKIYWTPSRYSSYRGEYIKPLFINENVEGMSMVLLSEDEKLLSSVRQSFYFNKATGKKITLLTPADKKYPGDGPFTLVNGVQNEKGMGRSSEFLGFLGTDMEAIIDLGKETEFKTVTVNSLTLPGSWIYQPQAVFYSTSSDGINFTGVPGIISEVVSTQERKTILRKQDGSSVSARFIKVVAKNFGIIPQGKPGAGTPAWLFVDEIEVQ